MALATTTTLTSLTMGDYVVVMNSDFDLTVRGEPYLALMFLLNSRNGRFMAREDFNPPLFSACWNQASIL